MIDRYAVINSDNIVENIIIADENFVLEGYILIKIDEDTCKIGDKYENDEFISVEVEPVEPELTTEEIILLLGQEVTNLKIENMEKDIIIDTLGQELTNIKLQLLMGGEI